RLDAVEEILQSRCNANSAVGKQVVDLGYLVAVGHQRGARGLRAYQLAGQEAVVGPLHRDRLYSATNIACTCAGRTRRLHEHRLTIEAYRGRVVDIVAGRLQAVRGRIQTR